MSQFEQIVKNIALETEKSNYNPEIDLNWCNLPMEMRLECVKRMDFRTRTRLSATSKTEKSLVEAKKHRFDQVRLYCTGSRVYEIWKLEPHSETIRYRDRKSSDAFVSAIFTKSEIQHFWLKGPPILIAIGTNNGILNEIVKFAQFQFKRVSIFSDPWVGLRIVNCVNLEKIDFWKRWYGSFNGFSYTRILDVPNVMKIKEFRFAHVITEEFYVFLNGLVEKWIDNDAEVGKSVQFEVTTRRNYDNLDDKFAGRIIDKSDETVRIRMDNPTKQIVLMNVGSREDSRFAVPLTARYCSCRVIPIDMPKSEYGKFDRWIQAIYKKELKLAGELENVMEFDAEDQAVWGDEYP